MIEDRAPVVAAPRMTAAPFAVEVQIDELVLHGFDPRDRNAIGDALERRLAELLRGDGLPASATLAGQLSLAQLDAGAFEVARGAKATDIGRRLADAVFEVLTQ